MLTSRRIFLSSLGALLATVVLHPRAQGQFPNKPIRLVVPFPPGGGADIAARVIAVPLGEALGQPVIVENKAGADGIIAGEAVMRAPPDGYTFLLGTATGLSGVPALRKTSPYDPTSDFTPIARLGTFVFFLFVNEQVPAKSMTELIAYVQANPGRINYGTGTTTAVIATAQLARSAKLEMVHIPYKGDGPLTAETVAGRVQVMFAAGGPALAHVRSGKLHPVATLLPNRSPLLPDVPTMSQSGVQVSIVPWAGLFGPPGLPRDIVDRLNREVVQVLARPAVREQLSGLAFDPQSSSPDELRGFVAEQLRDWKQGAAEAGIQPE